MSFFLSLFQSCSFSQALVLSHAPTFSLSLSLSLSHSPPLLFPFYLFSLFCSFSLHPICSISCFLFIFLNHSHSLAASLAFSHISSISPISFAIALSLTNIFGQNLPLSFSIFLSPPILKFFSPYNSLAILSSSSLPLNLSLKHSHYHMISLIFSLNIMPSPPLSLSRVSLYSSLAIFLSPSIFFNSGVLPFSPS